MPRRHRFPRHRGHRRQASRADHGEAARRVDRLARGRRRSMADRDPGPGVGRLPARARRHRPPAGAGGERPPRRRHGVPLGPARPARSDEPAVPRHRSLRPAALVGVHRDQDGLARLGEGAVEPLVSWLRVWAWSPVLPALCWAASPRCWTRCADCIRTVRSPRAPPPARVITPPSPWTICWTWPPRTVRLRQRPSWLPSRTRAPPATR